MGTQLTKKGGTATPNFRPCLLGPNDWMDKGGTWYGGRPQPRQYCVRSGPSPLEKISTAAPPLFGPYPLWPNGWMDQDATWYGDRPQPRPHCARWRPSSPRKGAQQPPLFAPCLLWPNGRPSQQLLSSFSFNTHCWLVGWLDEVLMVLFLT